MPSFVFTYDLASGTPDPHKPFLTAAAAEKLLYVIVAGTTVQRLPNTTVWGVFATRALAIAAFDRAVAATGNATKKAVVVEKRLVTALTDAEVRSDVKKAVVAKWTGATNFETARLHQAHDPFFA